MNYYLLFNEATSSERTKMIKLLQGLMTEENVVLPLSLVNTVFDIAANSQAQLVSEKIPEEKPVTKPTTKKKQVKTKDQPTSAIEQETETEDSKRAKISSAMKAAASGGKINDVNTILKEYKALSVRGIPVEALDSVYQRLLALIGF